jgi:uncharacterized protein
VAHLDVAGAAAPDVSCTVPAVAQDALTEFAPVLRQLSESAEQRVRHTLASVIQASMKQVDAAVELLDEGATVPFIARYRKERTGGLDDTQLRTLAEQLTYGRDLEARRVTIAESVASQGKLTAKLLTDLEAATTKQALEDLYLPYKPRRRTKAQIAREAGLEPLAEALLADRRLDPSATAQTFVAPERGIADAKAALEGARDILAERFAELPEVVQTLRERLWEEGFMVSSRTEAAHDEAEKFRDYFDYSEHLKALPSHRVLALFRGRQLGVLALRLSLGEEREAELPHPCVRWLAQVLGLSAVLGGAEAADGWLGDVLRWSWRVKLHWQLETELFTRLRQAAETEAIEVFAANLKDLLLAAPAGPKVVMGLDPGLRTGVKVAVVDATGKLLDTDTIYPHEPRREWDRALAQLAALAVRHGVNLVAIGNGTASRETDRLVVQLQRAHPELALSKVVVSEAGASVYSASALAAQEFPHLDVSVRGAVSIARRLQDPLAELVKIEPKAIGVGQYQHDVDQRALARSLDAVIEDCVNAVGVDVNTASAALLARVAGLNASVAERIVGYRDTHGPFQSRAALRDVPRLGEKTFEQAAGFLRIQGGSNPLDASAVHPEAYEVVQRILAHLQCTASALIGHADVLRTISPAAFTTEQFGLPTVRDILTELEKPGRDPRGTFVTARFQEGVETVADLKPGMVLEGVVTNVANFGAFVDIGVHQDGLVHISALSERFVRDPREVVRAGQVVTVKVLEVDRARQRIALTLRRDGLDGEARRVERSGRQPSATGVSAGSPTRRVGRHDATPQTAMQAAFAALKRGSQ